MNTEIITEKINEISSLCNECLPLLADSEKNKEIIISKISLLFTDAQKIKKESEKNSSVPNFAGFRALIVEDNEINLMVAQAFLKKTGCEIETAGNGKEALEKIKLSTDKKPYHFVLMDMQMPVMSGTEAVKELRKLDQSSYPGNLHVIAMTGNILENDIKKAFEDGFSDYIPKPVSTGVLYEKCSKIISNDKNIWDGKTVQLLPQNHTSTEDKTKISENNKVRSVSDFPDFSTKKILVVDDNKLNVEILNLMLNKTGAKYDNAYDGKEALEKYLASETGTYDMILMDIQMPEMDGNTCASKIRTSQRADSNVPIIAISANAFQEDKEKSLKAGINFHMSKPVNMKNLHAKMKEMLN